MKRLAFVSVAAAVITSCTDVTQPNEELSQLERPLFSQSGPSTSGSENMETLFGPEVFTRGRGKPVTVTRPVAGDDFANFEEPFVLHLVNGTEAGGDRISSAHVVLDGVELFGPSDFSQQVAEMSTAIALTEASELSVTLASKPGSQITIEIEGVLKGVKVEPGGGEVTIIEGKVTLDFPPGAIDDDIFITATPVPESELPDDPTIIPGTAFEFGPSGTEFDPPVTLCVQYDEDLLPDGTDESELRIHLLIDGEFIQLDAGTVDTENNIVCAEVDHFSVFVTLPRVRGREEDIEAPEIRANANGVTVSTDGISFGSTASIDVSGGDVTLFGRIKGTDRLTGISFMQVVFVNPSRTIGKGCFVSGNPVSGSDTNGEWQCTMVFPQYSESGTWTVSSAHTRDKVGNTRNYFRQADGQFCNPDVGCVSWDPVIEVTSIPEDVNRPSITDLAVSLDVTPRMFEQSATINVNASFQDVIFNVGALDDLSGVQSVFVQLRSPGGTQFRSCGSSFPVSGTTIDGDWECRVRFQQFSEEGTWTVSHAQVRDRVGNVNHYSIQSDGRLCRSLNVDCIAGDPPSVVVVSNSDITPPVLTGFTLSSVDATVTVTVQATDALSGVNRMHVSFRSSTSTQSQHCAAFTPSSGTTSDGTWECSFTFPELSATGSWPLSNLQLLDVAGNTRSYFRRATDGFLCTGSLQNCQDFGDTEVIVQTN